jgi:hypothetical protein
MFLDVLYFLLDQYYSDCVKLNTTAPQHFRNAIDIYRNTNLLIRKLVELLFFQ